MHGFKNGGGLCEVFKGIQAVNRVYGPGCDGAEFAPRRNSGVGGGGAGFDQVSLLDVDSDDMPAASPRQFDGVFSPAAPKIKRGFTREQIGKRGWPEQGFQFTFSGIHAAAQDIWFPGRNSLQNPVLQVIEQFHVTC